VIGEFAVGVEGLPAATVLWGTPPGTAIGRGAEYGSMASSFNDLEGFHHKQGRKKKKKEEEEEKEK